MSAHEFKVTYLLLEEYFGPVVASVCEELKWSAKPLNLISNNVKLGIATVKQALSILINFNFVGFKSSYANPAHCEYFLLSNNVLQFLKYPKFILIIRKKYGKEAEFVIRELLYSGKMTLYNLILKVTYNLSQEHPEIPYSLSTIKNMVCDLIENNFIVPIEKVTDGAIPIAIKLTEMEKVPNIDMVKLFALYHGTENFPKNELYWRINHDRFLVEYRNEIMTSALCKRFGNPTSVVMQHLLKLSFMKHEPWTPVSNPIPMMLLRDSISNDTNSAVSLQYVQPYLDEMEDDSSGFIGRSPEYSGATLVCFKDAFYNLSVECVLLVIIQKYGPKAARVFNIVRDKKYIEIEQIQRIAMLADKEAKQITYKLLEENFIQMQELRKPAAGLSSMSGPNKSFFLFYVDFNLVVKMVIAMAFKNLYNIMIRRRDELIKHEHIVGKKKQSDVLVKALKEQNASEEQISEMLNDILSPPEMSLLESLQKITKKLQLAELQIDETITLLQIYICYHKSKPFENKQKKRKKDT